MSHKILSGANALKIIQNFHDNTGEDDITNLEKIVGTGPLYPEDEIKMFRDKIISEINLSKDKVTDREKQRVEFQSIKWMHELLSIDRDAFRDKGFWIWMTIKYFKEYVEWRHASKDNPARINNYGLRPTGSYDITENILYRAWIRLKIGLDETLEDPFKYNTLIETYDFWQSFIVRRDFASCENIARAFINARFVNNRTKEKQLYRTIGRNITALQSNLFFNCLSEQDAEAIIDKKIKQSEVA